MPELIIKYIWLTFYIESFYYWNTLNFEIAPLIIGLTAQQSITTRGSKLERLEDKIRAILSTFGWLLLLYLVCVLC